MYAPVRALVRGLDVLQTVSDAGSATASDIADRLKLPQPTVVRLLDTLIAQGYVQRQLGTALFRVAPRTTTLSRGHDPLSTLRELAQPAIEELRAEIGWPSNLGIFDRDAMVVAYTNRQPNAFSVPGRFGARVPMLVTGIGLAYFAFQPLDERRSILQRLSQSKSGWDTDSRFVKNLNEKIVAVTKQGFALAEEEYLDAVYQSRIWAIAVPILVGTRARASLSALVLRSNVPKRRALLPLQNPLKAAAVKLAHLMSEAYPEDGHP